MKVDLPTPGTPGDADPGGRMDAGVAGLGEPASSSLGALAVMRAGGLDQRDRLRDRRRDAPRGLPREAGRRRWRGIVAEPLAQRGQEVEGRLGDDRAGREDRGGARLPQRVDTSSGGITPPIDDHDVGTALLGQRLLERGHQREVTGRERADTRRCARRRRPPAGRPPRASRTAGPRRRRSRGRRRRWRSTFWPRSWPSWPILATRMRGRRPSASLELVGGVEDLLDQGAVALAGGVAVHPADRTDHGLVAAVHLLQRVGDLADRGLGAGRVDGQREQVAVEPSPARSRARPLLVSASRLRRTSSSSRSARSRSSLAICWRVDVVVVDA